MAAAAVLAGSDVLVAGPAGPLGAVFAARSGAWPADPAADVTGPVLVVCGSANAVSHEQLAQLEHAGLGTTVVAPEATSGPLDGHAAERVAEQAHDVAVALQPGTIVLVGGDTAAAFLGDPPRLVGGFAAPGMPFSRDADGGGPLVVTKAGGFGTPDALVRLLSA